MKIFLDQLNLFNSSSKNKRTLISILWGSYNYGWIVTFDSWLLCTLQDHHTCLIVILMSLLIKMPQPITVYFFMVSASVHDKNHSKDFLCCIFRCKNKTLSCIFLFWMSLKRHSLIVSKPSLKMLFSRRWCFFTLIAHTFSCCHSPTRCAQQKAITRTTSSDLMRRRFVTWVSSKWNPRPFRQLNNVSICHLFP